jgi:hypothetical protein
MPRLGVSGDVAVMVSVSAFSLPLSSLLVIMTQQ